MTEDGRQALLDLAHGDMRRVINILQSTSMAFDVVSEEALYTCVGTERFANNYQLLWKLLSHLIF